MNSLKKIKASYLLIALAILLVITGGVFALKSFNSKKLKGASSKNTTYLSSMYSKAGVQYRFESKTPFSTLVKDYKLHMFGPLPSNFTVKLYIKNNNKFPIKISGINQYEYVINSGKSSTFNIVLGNSSYNSYYVFNNRQKTLIMSITTQTHYSKYYVLLFNNHKGYAGFTSSSYSNNVENITVNSYGNKSNHYEIYNKSGKTYYYRWFTYKYDRVNKNEISYNDTKGSCVGIGGNKSYSTNPGLTVSKKYPKRLGYVKIYSNSKSCKNDKYGTNNKDVVYTWQTKVYKK